MSDIARKINFEARIHRNTTIHTSEANQTWILAGLVVLPLVMVATQLALKLDGVVGYSLYKILFLVPPLIYCRMRGISVIGDVLRPANWRNHLPAAIGLGLGCGAIFLGVYFFAIDWLVDRSVIVERMGTQFSVTATTVALVAPVT
ncbi:MAG: hypothetical protein JXM70_03780, partial [Pirellulales bacterium]|nr:hypothetical protein [Pirellulales bacterium]